MQSNIWFPLGNPICRLAKGAPLWTPQNTLVLQHQVQKQLKDKGANGKSSPVDKPSFLFKPRSCLTFIMLLRYSRKTEISNLDKVDYLTCDTIIDSTLYFALLCRCRNMLARLLDGQKCSGR